MSCPPYETLPYRACAGLAVFNREGHVFIGRRLDGPEHIDATHCWQMPQGGIDPGEDTYRAALRELYEETSIRSVQKLGEIPEWLTYDIPREIAGHAWQGKYRGQTQKWYALRFTGEESEINIVEPGGGAHKPEFAGMALGAAGKDARTGGAVQGAGLCAGGAGFRAICAASIGLVLRTADEPVIASRRACRRSLV